MAKKSAKKSHLTPEEAEKQTKAAAKRRRIVIELTPEQLAALTEQWKKLNPAEAAELILQVKGQQTSLIKVAGYSYHGDTCCV